MESVQTVVPIEQLPPGTLVFRDAIVTPIINHYGILFEPYPTRIFHVDKSETNVVRGRWETFESFAEGRVVHFERPSADVSQWQMLERIQQIETGRLKFNLAMLDGGFNCESIARWVQGGAAVSTQVKVATTLIVGGIVVAAAVVLANSQK